MDITEVILHQHHEQRRLFALLDEVRDDTETAAAIWRRLAIFLEVHAEAEELYFYPHLLKVGQGEADADSVEEEVEDAVRHHNEIREGVRQAAANEPGSDAWWAAIAQPRLENDDHMAEEERQDLADFRLHAPLQLRHDIAVRFLRFEAQTAAEGITPRDKDPEEYVQRNS